MPMAHKLNMPIGFLAGFLQGAFGISAPATLTFLNAIKFERTEFIIIVSVFFMTMSLIQLPTLLYLGPHASRASGSRTFGHDPTTGVHASR